MDANWGLAGMVRDKQSITRDWQMVNQKLIQGVVVQEVKSVPTNNGYLTELYRSDWKLDSVGVGQIFQSYLEPNALSAWHVHGITTDRLFVATGRMKIVLYDARKDSPTFKAINQFRFGEWRHAMVVCPPGVWHGVHNIGAKPGILINAVDSAYNYENPDHYRLPANTDQIPFKFETVGQDALK